MGRASKVNRGNHIIWVCGTTHFSVWYHTAGGKWQVERSDVRAFLWNRFYAREYAIQPAGVCSVRFFQRRVSSVILPRSFR